MKLFERLSKCFSVIILMACVAAFALFGLSATGWKALAVPTGSMRPHIAPGSVVFVHRVPISSLKIGDVITYATAKPGLTISHRIVRTYSIGGKIPGFVTKGDANKFPDAPIAGGSIVGKVVWHVPHAGNWLMGSKSWGAIAVFVYLPALLITIDEIRRLNAYFKATMPRKPAGLRKRKRAFAHRPAYLATGVLTAVLVIVAGMFADPALALLGSTSAKLGPNTLTVVSSNGGGGGSQSTGSDVSCSSTTNVYIHDTSGQSAGSGSVSSGGNTAGGSATSGTVTNTNSSTTTITVTNGSCR